MWMWFRVWTGRLFFRGKSRHRFSRLSEEKKTSVISTRSSRPSLPPSLRPASVAPSHGRNRTTSRTSTTSPTSARGQGLLAAHCQPQTLKGDWLSVPLRQRGTWWCWRRWWWWWWWEARIPLFSISLCVSVCATGWKTGWAKRVNRGSSLIACHTSLLTPRRPALLLEEEEEEDEIITHDNPDYVTNERTSLRVKSDYSDRKWFASSLSSLYLSAVCCCSVCV